MGKIINPPAFAMQITHGCFWKKGKRNETDWTFRSHPIYHLPMDVAVGILEVNSIYKTFQSQCPKPEISQSHLHLC